MHELINTCIQQYWGLSECDTWWMYADLLAAIWSYCRGEKSFQNTKAGCCLLSFPKVKMLALSFLGALRCQTESCSATGLNDTPCQRGKFISSHWECHRLSCPEPRQVMDWIYPSLDKACAQACTAMHPHTHKHTHRHTNTQITVVSLHISVHISHITFRTYFLRAAFCLHNTHWQPVLKTCVTFSRHLDSWDQRQWYIVSSCMERGKNKTRR